MKVYVEDLLVKNCSCCDFCYTNSQGCVCKLTGHITRYDEPLEEMRSKCPLQSLSDYTKQVRKEVCEQIKAEFDTSGFNKIDASLYPPTEEAMWIGKGFNACKERLFNKLDQIQGVEDGDR